MKKKTFVTLEQLREIDKTSPTPYHLYDEQAIRENARRVNEAFSWNPGFKEYFAVKATPNPYILKLLHEDGSFRLIRRAGTPMDYFATLDCTEFSFHN